MTTISTPIVAAVAAGLVLGATALAPTLAQAGPVFTPASACGNYQSKGGLLQLELANQYSGAIVQIPASGQSLSGRATEAAVGRSTASLGNAFGNIAGRAIDVTVSWDRGPLDGNTWHFTGQVNDDGHASGTVSSIGGSSPWVWHTNDTLSCIAQAPGPATMPKLPPPAPTPLAGPTVSWDRVFGGGLVAHVTDHSGVDSVCTYQADSYQQRFFLPKNSTTDVWIVPAIPKFANWDITITCDNGTRTHTSTFF